MRIIFLAILATFFLQATAQVKGVITDKKNGDALIGANAYWLNAKKGASTNTLGIFELALPARLPDTLIISYTGYVPDTFYHIHTPTELSIKLTPVLLLNEAVITEEKNAITNNMINPFNQQSLGKAELKKAACCNLSESFETNATVDVSFTDAISGSKQIKVLGLDGAYTQILTEQIPGPRGLATNYGLTHIPGTWINAIDITKGVGSIVNGYESIAGQINIDLDKPEKADKLFVNLYAGDAGRFEANVQTAHRLNKKWSTLLLAHANTVAIRNDFNKDDFLDVPLGYQANVMNRWKYENPGKLMADFSLNALVDERIGGQANFKTKSENTLKQIYGVNIATKHAEATGKLAWGFAGQPYKSIGLMANGKLYQHQAYFGLKNYNGQEQTGYANLIYQSIIVSSEHKFKTGASFMYDRFAEQYQDSSFNRTEVVPGAFAEYHAEIPGKFNALAGARVDYHNMFGVLFNPRLHVKYHLKPFTVLRASAGRGLRVANIFVEHSTTMASNRQVKVLEKLNPEIAWNMGTSLTHQFKIAQKNATFIIDFYRTDFKNQVVADMDASPNSVLFYNLKGQAFSNSFQTEFIYEPVKKLELRFAYKHQEAKTTYSGKLLQRPFVPTNRLLVNVSYATRFDKWKFDATLKWFDKQRIPNTQSNPTMYVMANKSPAYYTLNAQVTRAFKKWEFYIGAENMLNYIQQNQIIDSANPFGNYFDSSMIWGPIMGRVIYSGLRFTIK